MYMEIRRLKYAFSPFPHHQQPPNGALVLARIGFWPASLRPREETGFAISEASEFEEMALIYRTSVGKILADAHPVVYVGASCFAVFRSSLIWSHPKRGHFRTRWCVSAVVR